MKNLLSVCLYVRITDEKGRRRYEQIRCRNPQVCGTKRRLLWLLKKSVLLKIAEIWGIENVKKNRESRL